MDELNSLAGAVVCSVLLALTVCAQEQVEAAGNAATVLRQAFEVMPVLTEEEQRLFDGDIATGDRQAELLRRMDPSLLLLREAAGMPECQWGLPFREKGFNTPMPHLQQVRALARLADWHAQAQLPGKPDAFMGEELATLCAARHVGRDGPLISLLVEYAIERKVVDSLARHLPELSDEDLASLAVEWSTVPSGGDLRTALLMEKAFGIDRLIKTIREAMEKYPAGRETEVQAQEPEGPEATTTATNTLADELRVSAIMAIDGLPIRIGLETMEGDNFYLSLGQKSHGIKLISADYEREEAVLFREGQAALVRLRSRQIVPFDLRVSDEALSEALGPRAAEELLGSGGGTGVSVLTMLSETSADFERLADAVSLPFDEFQRWYQGFMEETATLNSFSRIMVPALDSARAKTDAVKVRRQMLATAIDVMRFGPDAVEHSVDPSGGKPFGYVKTDTGFTLVSAMSLRDKPVALTIGSGTRP